jgi:hypothetical protein
LGGVVALINISIFIEWLNKRWFEKEIKKKIDDGTLIENNRIK